MSIKNNLKKDAGQYVAWRSRIRIYTGRGDDGTVGLISGERVSKSNERIDAFGDIDELSSALGVLRAGVADDAMETDIPLRRIQSDLLKIGTFLAAWRNLPLLGHVERIGDEDIRFIESSIDVIEEILPDLKGFLLSAGHPSAASAHLARSICHRAERKVVRLSVELKVGRPPRQLKSYHGLPQSPIRLPVCPRPLLQPSRKGAGRYLYDLREIRITRRSSHLVSSSLFISPICFFTPAYPSSIACST